MPWGNADPCMVERRGKRRKCALVNRRRERTQGTETVSSAPLGPIQPPKPGPLGTAEPSLAPAARKV